MPDALSTTIPIWCAVLNLALLPSHPLSHELHLPPYITASTHSQIAALLPDFLSSLQSLHLRSFSPSLSASSTTTATSTTTASPTLVLTKPLRPFWITQDSLLPDEPVAAGALFEEYRPVICCTASRRVLAGSEADEQGYIQGAGDDTENWAHGLTPTVYWTNMDALLEAAEVDVPDIIKSLLEKQEKGSTADGGVRGRVKVTPRISVCPLPLHSRVRNGNVMHDNNTDDECHICLTTETTVSGTWVKSKGNMQAGVGRGKAGSRRLRQDGLSVICRFASEALTRNPQAEMVVACESGKDLSVGVALALDCYLFEDDGRLRTVSNDNDNDNDNVNVDFTKTTIRARLGGIMTACPDGNPSRATLQAVNSFLMDQKG